MSCKLKIGERLWRGIWRIEKEQIDRTIEQLKNKRYKMDGKAIHRARKDLKRARATLRLVRNVLKAKDYRKTSRRFRDAGQALSQWRDAEVLLKTVDKLRRNGTDRRTTEILTRFKEVLSARYDKLPCRSPAVGEIKSKLWLARNQIKSCRLNRLKWRDLSGGCQRSYKQGRKALKEAERTRAPERLHYCRKRVKDLWYQLRVLDPYLPEAMAEYERGLGRLSNFLGDDHDLLMFKEAAQTAKLGKWQTELLDKLLDPRRENLEQAAFKLGHRLYDVKPTDFGRQIDHHVKKWRCRRQEEDQLQQPGHEKY
jgi:CHAD domain-containing protein